MLVRCSWTFSGAVLSTADRHALLQRIQRASRQREATLLAFGLGNNEVRLIFEGSLDACEQVLRAVKIGTVRTVRRRQPSFDSLPHALSRLGANELAEAVAWCHTPVPVDDPLAWPWSSHRDLLGLRDAAFFDARTLRRRVSARRVHSLAGGGSLPRRTRLKRVGLNTLLRAAAAVLGRLPADPKSFAIFVQLAKELGYATGELARALNLTTRRVRQLAAQPHPMTSVAALYLVDERLAA